MPKQPIVSLSQEDLEQAKAALARLKAAGAVSVVEEKPARKCMRCCSADAVPGGVYCNPCGTRKAVIARQRGGHQPWQPGRAGRPPRYRALPESEVRS